MKQVAQVIVVMGSSSDLRVMSEATILLSDWKIAVETQIVSAHRTPELLESSVTQWQNDGVKVIIAGAGGAAHLPGMIASFSTLPVIGVPVGTKTMNGLDSLLSIAQMPRGVPVATVAVDNATNAALLAIQILATDSGATGKKFTAKLHAYKKKLSDKVKVDRHSLAQLGVKKFMKRKS